MTDPLSEPELKVLRLVAVGMSNREVAEELYLSINTVKWYLKHIYEKIDVHSRVAAVTRAQELGLLIRIRDLGITLLAVNGVSHEPVEERG